MLNIICNANPTIQVSITIDKELIENKTISLNQSDAEELFVNLQTKPNVEWEELSCLSNVINKLKTNLQDNEHDYDLQIKFDDSYIEYMTHKYPSKDYSEYYERYETI